MLILRIETEYVYVFVFSHIFYLTHKITMEDSVNTDQTALEMPY